MKSVLFTLAMFVASAAFAQSHNVGYTRFTDHPAFKAAYQDAIADDHETGRPQVITIQSFGEGGDFWTTYLYVQKLAPLSPKVALVLRVETSGIVLDCGLGEELPPAHQKLCKGKDFVNLFFDVKVQEVN